MNSEATVFTTSDLAPVEREVDVALHEDCLRVVLLQTQAEAAGAQAVSSLVGQGLSSHGWEVHHVFLYRRTSVFDEQSRTHFCARRRPGGIGAAVRMFISLVRFLRRTRPDAIVCFQHYGNLIGGLAATLCRVRVVIANPTSTAANLPGWVRWTDRLFGTIGVFTRVVMNSRTATEAYRSYPESYRARLMMIEHGFAARGSTVGGAEARRLFGIPANCPVLSCVARLHPMKNLDAAVKLLAVDPTWHLAVAGQGQDRARLLQLAGSLGVAERLHLVGEVKPDRIGEFLAASDIFVFPSRAETFGLAAVEAAQVGRPVVANDLPVLREVLAVDGQPCALFVDVDDTQAFALRVRALLDNPLCRAALTKQARALSQRYSIDAMVAGYVGMLKQLVVYRETALSSKTGGQCERGIM